MIVKKKALTFTIALLFSTIAGAQLIDFAYAQSDENIIINTDGSITPSTASLKKAGNIYSLTRDINGTITVDYNNTLLDGNNHKLIVPSIFSYGITLNNVSNVTITNFIIIGGAKGIDISGTTNTIMNNTIRDTDNGIYSLSQPTAAITLNDASSNVITGNNLESNRVGLILVSWHSQQCSNNEVIGNNFAVSSTAIIIYDSSNNRFYHNNFLNNSIILQDNGYSGYSLPSFNIWDDGQQYGNYWSDYIVRYPNSTEIDKSGVGDTPYFVKPNNFVNISDLTRQEARDYWTQINAQYANNTDYHPLMQPFAFPSYSPTPEPTPEVETFSITFAIVTSVVLAIIMSLLIYFKKRKR